MRLTTKGRYAVTAMLDLALHHEQGPISLADISQRQEISLSYLEQLFSRLRRRGLVRSTRGPGGGYKLGKDAAETSVAAIVDAVSEKYDATACHGRDVCPQGTLCLSHYLWLDLSDRIYQFLEGISLADLVQRREIQTISGRQERRYRGDIQVAALK